MRCRNALVAARGQILWIVFLALSSVMILQADLSPPAAPVAAVRF